MVSNNKPLPTSPKYLGEEGGGDRRNYQGLAPLTREIRHIIKPILGKHGFARTDILENWENMVGADLAQGTVPERLAFERDERTNGTLHVKAAGGAFAMLLEHQKDRVIGQVNTFFGYRAVAKIKIVQGALKLKKPMVQLAPKKVSPQEIEKLVEKTKNIEDAELRQKMIDVGVAMLKK